ncbi:TPA: hypothetical protein RUX44_000088 [Aeromonas hydrophila]|uniref:hypothetical protein n=1 Tax=Aeromonas hydrophila TaxID=644 RepID=UPI0005CE966C|nr:hypothetical protein [Aeromonas hydrophila]AJQ54753.1 hypothetical protein RY45_11910 [Aeromonas hydrophila]MDL5383587.1 hypothetical protein [Aeromonas hydrophila]HAU4882620.1 hypothetical protein [Aeromonas hydrophila]HDZ8911796.1 hypothetical protein [Aeromonas hydrophila]
MIIKGNMQGVGGVEFATFRLKEGVTEADLLALAHRVESEFLVQQSELIVHCLLRGADGLYADLVMAPSQSLVETYCQQWLHNAVAGEYLTLLDHDSVNMSFWTRIG